MDRNTILVENLESALYLAIQLLAEREKKVGQSFVSAQRAAFQENLDRLRGGEALEIVYE